MIYDAAGRRTLRVLDDGTRVSYTCDAANQVTELANLQSNSTPISKFQYKYDAAGNRTGILEADGSRVTYLYDNGNRLIGEHRTGTNPYRNTFSYDPAGNRLVKDLSGSRTTYVYDNANQLPTAAAAAGVTTYIFDANRHQLIEM